MSNLTKAAMTVFLLLALSACAPVSNFSPAPSFQLPQLPPPRITTPPSPPAEEIVQPPRAESVMTAIPAVAAAEPPPPPALKEAPPVAALPQPDYYESSASYYAKRFKGRRTASGERYDPELFTAATRDFPLQSWLKVINPANGREVVVRVNDRTGKRKTPLVDLSRAAAKELGFLGKGKIRVLILPLPPPT